MTDESTIRNEAMIELLKIGWQLSHKLQAELLIERTGPEIADTLLLFATTSDDAIRLGQAYLRSQASLIYLVQSISFILVGRDNV